jgi:hypothetical protein
MEPADKGSGKKGFVFLTQPKIDALLPGCSGNHWFASLLAC